MKLVSSFVTLLLSRLGQVAASLRAAFAAAAPRPALVLRPIPIRADRRARLVAEHRRRSGL